MSDTRIVITKKHRLQIVKNQHKKNLFKELGRIKPTEYEGKEYCRSCWNAVYKHHKAISCDLCGFWTHLKCSDMGEASYKKHQKERNFKWTCTTCRSPDETLVPETPVSANNNAEPPKSLEDIQSLEGGLIIHANCRSINGKLKLNKEHQMQ